MPTVRVTSEPFDADVELSAFARARRGAGALASFIGYCREDHEGKPIERLELEHYPGFTENEIVRFTQSILARRNLIDLLVVHRSGAVLARAPIVLVAALARSRADAFGAVEELMDFLKTDAPFWKRELTSAGARWVEPTNDDRSRRGRWSSE
ncbi:MAG TPA: molybdenum cofactor biosynthesis protein MoaE [Vitreimonas sp.]|nr:molybdenum cofactor biosynthesis protein MoaE [Vitreimonas sp.]